MSTVPFDFISAFLTLRPESLWGVRPPEPALVLSKICCDTHCWYSCSPAAGYPGNLRRMPPRNLFWYPRRVVADVPLPVKEIVGTFGDVMRICLQKPVMELIENTHEVLKRVPMKRKYFMGTRFRFFFFEKSLWVVRMVTSIGRRVADCQK